MITMITIAECGRCAAMRFTANKNVASSASDISIMAVGYADKPPSLTVECEKKSSLTVFLCDQKFYTLQVNRDGQLHPHICMSKARGGEQLSVTNGGRSSQPCVKLAQFVPGTGV